MPEVSLVAVLDADKEGFLRSVTSLVQTIGRAARHVDGTALLYADRVTNAMAIAIRETTRRRAIQADHNQRHGVTPRPVVRSGAGSDLMLDLLDEAKQRRDKAGGGKKKKGGGSGGAEGDRARGGKDEEEEALEGEAEEEALGLVEPTGGGVASPLGGGLYEQPGASAPPVWLLEAQPQAEQARGAEDGFAP